MGSNYMSPEISGFNIDGGEPDFSKGVEVAFDDALLMSFLLEESQAGDHHHHHHHHENDDERLRSVIQSLEAEIGPNTLMSSDHGSCGAIGMNPAAAEITLTPSVVHDHGELLNAQGDDQMDHLGIDFELVDMEMMVPSSPSNHHDMDDNYWYMEPSEINDVIEFGVRDYSQICYEVSSEEHGYSSLWQE